MSDFNKVKSLIEELENVDLSITDVIRDLTDEEGAHNFQSEQINQFEDDDNPNWPNSHDELACNLRDHISNVRGTSGQIDQTINNLGNILKSNDNAAIKAEIKKADSILLGAQGAIEEAIDYIDDAHDSLPSED